MDHSSALQSSKEDKRVISKEASPEKDSSVEEVEHDIIVRIPPKRRYSIDLEVKSIRKAEPKVVEP